MIGTPGWLDMGDDQSAPTAPIDKDSELTRGLRSGATRLEGGLHALAGGVGEVLGASDFARDRFARSKELAAQAETEAPRVGSYKDVHGVRDFVDYTAGLIGGSVPTAVAGLGAAALTKTPLKGVLAATAATAPMEIGGVLEAQQNDPVAMQRSAGDRLGNAFVTGTAKAAIGNVVPVLAGGKILGRGAATAERGVAAAIGDNVVTDVVGNAAAGAASAKVGQFGADALNPNRDTTHDIDELKEGAVSGGVVGGAFGVAGGLGEAVHARKPSFDLDNARKIAKDLPLHAVKDEAGIAASDKTATDKVMQYAQQMMEDGALSPEIKAQISEAMKNVTDPANRAFIAAQKVGADLRDKAFDLADRVAGKKKERPPADTTPQLGKGTTYEGEYSKKSEDYSGVRGVIEEHVLPAVQRTAPELMDHPEGIQAVGSTVRQVIEAMRKGERLGPKTFADLHTFLGDDMPTVLHDVYTAVLGKEPTQEQANFYSALTRLTGKISTNKSLSDVVTKHSVSEGTPGEVAQLVTDLRRHVRRETTFAKPTNPAEESKAAERKYKEAQLDAHLTKQFGEGKDKVLEAFQKEYEGDKAKEEVQAAKKPKTDEGDLEASKAEAAKAEVVDQTLETGDLADQYEKPTEYHGKDGPFVPSHESHILDFGNENSQADRLMKQARAENPDRNVSFVSAKDYAEQHNQAKIAEAEAHAKENGLSPEEAAKHPALKQVITPEQLHQATGGKPENFGVVMAEGMKQEGRITKETLDSVKLDSRSFGKSDARINIGGQAFDATRITRTMLGQYKHIEDGKERVARAFFDGVAAVMEAHGAGPDANAKHVESLNQKIADVQARIDKLMPSLKDVPPLQYEKIKIERPVMVNGKETTERVSAKEALTDIRKERDAYKALLTCVGG